MFGCSLCQVNACQISPEPSHLPVTFDFTGVCCCVLVGPLWTQVPLQPFHPDNKEPPAARTGGLLNEISYQSTNSCGLCLASRSGYESPSAALNSYYLDVYLLWGEKKTPALFKVSLCGSRLPKQGNAPPKERVSFTCY